MKKILQRAVAFMLRFRMIRKFVFLMSGITFVRADTEELLEEVYKIRYKIYLESGYVEVNKEQRFKDPYDDDSVNFLAYKKGKLVGTFRLVLYGKNGLSTEKYYNFNNPGFNHDEIAEIGRFAILKDKRGGSRILTIGMLQVLLEEMKRRNITCIYVTLPGKLAYYFRRFGIELHEMKQLPLTEIQEEGRKEIAGYFEKNTTIKPYYIDVREL